MKTVVIFSGVHPELLLKAIDDGKVVYVGRFQASRIWLCDIVVTAVHSDQVFLCNHKGLLQKFIW